MNQIALSIRRWPLLLLFAVMFFYGAADTGLFEHEARVLWIVEDVASTRAAPADAVRAVRANLTALSERLHQAEQPPLYFLILDVWTSISGESLAAVRVLSLLAALLACVLTAAGIPYVARRSDVMPGFLLAGSIMIYAGRGVYLYAVVLMFSALALWALLRWRQQPQVRSAVIYAMALAACLGTAHGALGLLPLHALIVYRAGYLRRWLPLMLAALVIMAPLLILSRPGALFVFDRLHVLVAPGVVAALPLAVVWLMGAGAHWRVVWALLVFSLLAGLTLDTQRPPWVGIIDEMNASRHPLDVSVTSFAPDSALAYYDRQPGTPVRQGISLMLGWRDHSPEELRDYAGRMGNAPAVWLVLPIDSPEAGLMIPALLLNRPLTWQREADGVRFYRFGAVQRSE